MTTCVEQFAAPPAADAIIHGYLSFVSTSVKRCIYGRLIVLLTLGSQRVSTVRIVRGGRQRIGRSTDMSMNCRIISSLSARVMVAVGELARP